MSNAMKSALTALQSEYEAECAKRDAVNAANEPLEAKLDKANAEVEAARAKAMALAAQIDANRGDGWLELKRRIGRLANSIMEVRRT